MKQRILLVKLLCLYMVLAVAQTKTVLKPVKVGDKMPGLLVKHLHNWNKQSEYLSFFYKDKPLIIAFWDTHCNTCLKSFPKLDSLRRINNGSFNVLSVSQQGNEEIVQLFSSVKLLRNIQLPYVSNDTILNTVFKHVFLPHVAWINTKGIVCAITSEDEVTNESIMEFVRNDKINLFEKDDDFSFDINKPYEPSVSSIQYRSVFSAYNPAIAGTEIINGKRDSVGNISDSLTRAFFANYDALNLLFIPFAALCGIDNYGRPLEKRIVNNSALARFDDAAGDSLRKNINWKFKNLYCYDLIMQPENKTRFFKRMLEDINSSLPVTGDIEERIIPCYKLVKLNNVNNELVQNGIQPVYQNYFDTVSRETVMKLQDLPLSIIINDLNTYSRNYPIFNETGSNEPVNLEIRLKIGEKDAQVQYDTENLKLELNKNGYDIVRSEKLMSVLVINDKKR